MSCDLFFQTQRMEGERERLNRRISALTGKLADAKFSSHMEAFDVRFVLTSLN